ncbi:helix-hairpin-helix domain-containing protein [Cytobacillus oceanisediminis]|uniref:helix-hairpin-helix domain-containing protein n=1 Tax=Cytobacillus oceanisediminis TaxID=665099 RepID=UPI0023D9F78A|nr:helix-hairpin-helix domain-containing protein [Cytobacillus oceanisediminis]MDF2038691.1 helix-hairpin-helix domain-containing protein [Cytobacillus oceanisediminis]
MPEWIKTHKIYFAGAAIALAAFLYYFFMPVQENEVFPEIEQPVLLNENEDGDKEIETEGDGPAGQMPQPMKADIKGAVQKPGVYEAAEGDRVIDLLEKAGGLTEKADGTKINFALNITDEMVIYVPEKGEVLEEATAGGNFEARGQQDNGKINLNQADESELQTLPGIGPSKAAAIIEHRETNGSFKDIADLKLISGIGEKTFEKLKEHISVK